ncbi:Modification methylase PaeR7I [Lactobacillus helveticus]|uniref:Eco57I restriction-modification methylase domain-containing protein n=1 Tax=Lactobacillus helveticus TaxID=1587 RepID=UPI001562A3BB|nr:N-6 DNA methylase [Lactobacillus helveticus]NRN81614.1 Modification methylase PaeR7I [Lactobacillus helveticus]NRO25116.1 Modification methylase PaeR7I [Lactobacillus helveticus]
MLDIVRKEQGIQYTPTNLADLLAIKLKYYSNNYFPEDKKITILDPACGDGSLLKSIDKYFSNYKSIGIDLDITAIDKAKQNLESTNTELINMDYLDYFDKPVLDKTIDLIIANPPYIRNTVMGAARSQELSSRFKIKGRLDMYQVFLQAMTENLRENGIICVITSNRYLTTKGGADTRKWLNENYKIFEILDLGDTKPFSAAVLPAIFIGQKKKNANNNSVPFTRIYETNNSASTEAKSYPELLSSDSGIINFNGHNYELIKGVLDASKNPKEVWNMATLEDNQWAKELEEHTKYKFDDVFKVHVGIKTTADNVFIKKDWSDLPISERPESPVLHNLISSKTITKWVQSDKKLLKILYTNKMENGKRTVIDFTKYPKAWNYLLNNKEQLAKRKYLKRANREWYEIWVPQRPDIMSKNKVVFPDISPNAKFMYDNNGLFVDGNCYWITVKPNVDEKYLLLATAVANSDVMQKYHTIKFQNVLYSGRKRYITQYVKEYLLPDIENTYSKKIIALMQSMLEEGKYNKKFEEKINYYVQKCFELK